MPDPDLEIREAQSFRPPGGGGVRGGLQKNCFSALQAPFWSKNKGGGAVPLGPFPGSATGGDAPLRNGVTAGDVNKF